MSDLLQKISSILKDRPDALAFLNAYSLYCHRIDDILDDKEKRSDSLFILDTFMMAEEIYASNFYQQYYCQLYPIQLVVQSNYKMSVKLEHKKNAEMWERILQDVLRHAAHDMVIIVVYIVTGDRKIMFEISEELREYSMANDCPLQLAQHTENHK